MNWSALLSFLHPMLTVVAASVWVIVILKREYSSYIQEEVFTKENISA